jgi:hypothetical protein
MEALFFIIAFFAVIAVAIGRLVFARSPEKIGKYGEDAVSSALSRLDADVYHVMNDIMIPDGNGGTTQIDHVVFSPYGIFVIETKNYSGWIFGDVKSARWCSTHYGDRHYFQNPYRQNYKHICCLSSLMRLPRSLFISAVAFPGDCTVKTRDKLPPSFTTSGGELRDFILSHTTVQLEKTSLASFETMLRQAAIANDEKSVALHVSYLRQRNRGS